jgi:hypothetical protein
MNGPAISPTPRGRGVSLGRADRTERVGRDRSRTDRFTLSRSFLGAAGTPAKEER